MKKTIGKEAAMILIDHQIGTMNWIGSSAIIADLAVNWASEDGSKLVQILGEEILGASH
jgi:hypothetical protein